MNNIHAARRGLVDWLLLLVAALLPLTAGRLPARAGGIFDDDYTPPKRVENVPPKAAEAHPPVPPPVTPAPPIPDNPEPRVTPPTLPPDRPAVPARRPIPIKFDQAKSRKLMKDVYAAELADRSATARKALAEKLLDEAGKSADNATDQFVLLAGTIEAAGEAGDLALCFQAADRLAEAYDLDGLAVKASAATKLQPRGDAADGAKNVRVGLELLDQLEAADDFATAARVAAALQKLAANDPALRAGVQKRAKNLDELRVASDRVGPALEKLKTSPDDPTANLAAGSFYCFRKGQWDRGLPHLAKGGDAKLIALARRDVAAPGDAAARADLADDWWKAASTQLPTSRAALIRRAAFWYDKALPDLSGLRQLAAKQRVAEANSLANVEPSSRVINLLPLIDPSKDAVNGTWQWQRQAGSALTCGGSAVARLQIPYVPPAEYDFRMVFSRVSGEHVDQMLPLDGELLLWNLGRRDASSGREFVGFSNVDGHVASFCEGFVLPEPLRAGRKYASVVKVRKDTVEGYFEDKLVVRFKRGDARLADDGPWSLKGRDALGVGCHETPTIFYTLEVREVTGTGKPLR